jgi:hypothetical protein
MGAESYELGEEREIWKAVRAANWVGYRCEERFRLLAEKRGGMQKFELFEPSSIEGASALPASGNKY